MYSAHEIFIVLVLLAFFACISYRKKSLDISGVILGSIVGLVVYLAAEFIFRAGLAYFIVMLIFFIAAELSTRYARSSSGTMHERRTAGNILGNSGAAVIALALGSGSGFFGAMSAALADTLSSEIGMMSGRKPRLITTGRKVDVGANGGVTSIGFFGAIIGALIIAAIYFVLFNDPKAFLILSAAGIGGSIIDSFAGALFEMKGRLNNTAVNFIGSSCGAFISFLLFSVL